MANKDTIEESGMRGTTVRTEFGRENDDDGVYKEGEARKGRDMPDKGLSRQISSGKVPEI